MKPIPYGRQEVTEADIEAVVASLRSDFLTQGPRIEEFEARFAEYIGAKYAVAVNNGTSALHLSALALDVNSSSRVITTPITFAATANCVSYCGGEAVFADIDPHTALIDFNRIEDLLRKSPNDYQGVIPVDFAGYPVHLEELKKLTDKYGLWLLEDACHAPGGAFTDSAGVLQNCGNGQFADVAIFSFHPVKHIATGEGGMITTNRRDIYEKLLLLRTHGITKNPDYLRENHGGWYYDMVTLGHNCRLTDIQAALGISQLKKANERLEKRQQIAKKYRNAFDRMPFQIIAPDEGVSHAWHLFVIQTDRRKALYDFLRERNVFTQVHYIPVHLLSYYQSKGWKKGDFPAAEAYYEKCLSLPMFPSLSDDEIDYVVEQVKEFFSR